MNESQEKLSHTSGIIGQFGGGLKDALATFHRRGVGVLITSTHGIFRLCESIKHGFGGITTLHVKYDDRSTGLQGTDWVLTDLSDAAVIAAKAMFMKFYDEEVLEATQYGEIIRRHPEGAPRVYITGVLANEEPGFLFSYNVTSLTPAMKKRLNRERLNVGRTTYADRVKMIIREARSEIVHNLLADQVVKRAAGDQCDEMQWIEVSELAMSWLYESRESASTQRAQQGLPPDQESRPVIFVTEPELRSHPDTIDNALRDRHEVVVISEAQEAKLECQAQTGGLRVRTFEAYKREYNQTFQYQFVDRSALTAAEISVFDRTEKILELVGIRGAAAPRVLISNTMRVTSDHAGGVWDSEKQAIIILRGQLSSGQAYAGTLLHEAAHATSGHPDVSREFESVLTKYLGTLASATLTPLADHAGAQPQVRIEARSMAHNSLDSVVAEVFAQEPAARHAPHDLPSALAAGMDASQRSAEDADVLAKFKSIARSKRRPNAITVVGTVCFSQKHGIECCVRNEDGDSWTVCVKFESRVDATKAAKALKVTLQPDELVCYTNAVQMHPPTAGSALLYKVQQREPVNLGPMGWAYQDKLVMYGVEGEGGGDSDLIRIMIKRDVLPVRRDPTS